MQKRYGNLGDKTTVVLLGISARVGYVILTVSCFFTMITGVKMGVQLFAFIQQVLPEEMMGKIFSRLMAIILCALPVGQWLAGSSFEHFADLPWVVLLTGTALTGIVGVYSRSCFRKIAV